jgi:hypothetical protein
MRTVLYLVKKVSKFAERYVAARDLCLVRIS